MDVIERKENEQDMIQNPSGLSSRIYGRPELVAGVNGKALEVKGRAQWVRVANSTHKAECFGDLDYCLNGEKLNVNEINVSTHLKCFFFYLSFILQIFVCMFVVTGTGSEIKFYLLPL